MGELPATPLEGPDDAGPGRWLEVELRADPEQEVELALLLESRHIGGWKVEGEARELCWVFYLPTEEGWRERLGSLAAASGARGGEIRVRGSVCDQDWGESWKQFHQPHRVGRSLTIVPSWIDYRAAAGERALFLDPGMAFGTGHHASTALCLELEEEWLEGREDLRVLDVGTGSGILAIAAALLGAAEVVAVDCDEVAVRVASSNAARNGVADRVRVLLWDGPPPGSYSLVLANLVADQVIGMAEGLARKLPPGGRLVVGGIAAGRRGEVEAVLSRHGLTAERAREREGWSALQLVRAP